MVMTARTEAIYRALFSEETAFTRVIVNYGYGYRCFPFTSLRGETVFTVCWVVFPPPAGKLPLCQVFRLEGFSVPVEIGNLYALDTRATASNQPYITLDGSILVPTQNNPDRTHIAIWRYDGISWSKTYEDTGTDLTTVAHFSQDPQNRAIYGGYRNSTKSRVLKSTDDGKTWSLVYDVTEASTDDAYLYGCAAYFNNVILTKREKRTYIRSTNGGSSWTESAVLPTLPRTVNIIPDLHLAFISNDNYLYYSRDWFASYNRIRIQSGTSSWALRYPIMIGGRLFLSAVGYGTVILASKDLYHMIVPVFSNEDAPSARISGYGDFLFVGAEFHGTLTRINLPKTLERGFSCPILLWESASVPDTGANTDYTETQYNDKKTFYLVSNQGGTLYIQAYDEVAADFKDTASVSISAGTLTTYNSVDTVARLMRLRFVPTAAATVSAWAVLGD